MGENYFEKGNFKSSLVSFYSAVDLEPENPLGYYKLGLTYGYLAQTNHPDNIIVRGKRNRLSRIKYHDDSNVSKAILNFEKAYELGYREVREVLRALYDNIQHLDVQY